MNGDWRPLDPFPDQLPPAVVRYWKAVARYWSTGTFEPPTYKNISDLMDSGEAWSHSTVERICRKYHPDLCPKPKDLRRSTRPLWETDPAVRERYTSPMFRALEPELEQAITDRVTLSWTIDNRGLTVDGNDPFCRVMQRSHDELHGYPATLLLRPHGDPRDPEILAIVEQMKRLKHGDSLEEHIRNTWIQAKDDTVIEIEDAVMTYNVHSEQHAVTTDVDIAYLNGRSLLRWEDHHAQIKLKDQDGRVIMLDGVADADGAIRVVTLGASIVAAMSAALPFLLDSMDGKTDHIIRWCRILFDAAKVMLG